MKFDDNGLKAVICATRAVMKARISGDKFDIMKSEAAVRALCAIYDELGSRGAKYLLYTEGNPQIFAEMQLEALECVEERGYRIFLDCMDEFFEISGQVVA